MKWSENESKPFEQAPAGTHEAICIGVIDLGTQLEEYQGTKSERRKVVLQWELPTCIMESGKPFVVSKFYTAGLGDTYTLRQHLEAWRAKPFTKEELSGFESKNILGKPCLLSIIHNEAGKARVTGVMACPKGMTLPPIANPTVYFSMEKDDFRLDVYDAIGKGLQEIIRKSPEWAELQGVDKPKQGHSATKFDDVMSDIPF